MSASPRVSIVMPVWNGERFLAQATESLLEQTFSRFELLIVDDGSTDGTAEIARQYALCDDRIRVIRRRHGGIAEALNTGIRAARAQYIARMDGDDVCLPRRLELQIAYLDSHPRCAVVGSDIELMNEQGESIGAATYPSRHTQIISTLLGGRRCPFAHPSVVMRAGALRAVGGYEAADCPCEDYSLWLRLIGFGTFANISEPLLRYRRHRDSISARENDRGLMLTRALLNSARAGMGLTLLRSIHTAKARPPIAAYHHECAKALLRTGNRTASMRSASASIACDPRWLKSYALLAASLMPVKIVSMLAERMNGTRVPWQPSCSAHATLHETE